MTEFKFSTYELEMLIGKLDNLTIDFDIENISTETDPHKKWDLYFDKLMEIRNVNSNLEFLHSYMKLSNVKRIEIKNDDWYEEDLESYLYDLRDSILQIESEIYNLKSEGFKPSKVERTRKKKKHTPEQKKELEKRRLILELFLKNNPLFTDIVAEKKAEVINILTHEEFQLEKTRQHLSNRPFSKEDFQNAIDYFNSIVKQLEQNKMTVKK